MGLGNLYVCHTYQLTGQKGARMYCFEVAQGRGVGQDGKVRREDEAEAHTSQVYVDLDAFVPTSYPSPCAQSSSCWFVPP